MSILRNVSPFLLTAVLAVPGAAQMSPAPGKTPLPSIQSGGSLNYQFEGIYGGAGGSADARVVFTQEDESNLCVTLATRRGPKEIQKGLFTFFRITEVDGEVDRRRLKFPFPKKPEMTDENQRLFKACLDENPVDGATQDRLEVMVRRPRKHHVQAPLLYPPVGYLSAIELFNTANGEMESRGWMPPEEG